MRNRIWYDPEPQIIIEHFTLKDIIDIITCMVYRINKSNTVYIYGVQYKARVQYKVHIQQIAYLYHM